jgi:hypothetical protein
MFPRARDRGVRRTHGDPHHALQRQSLRPGTAQQGRRRTICHHLDFHTYPSSNRSGTRSASQGRGILARSPRVWSTPQISGTKQGQSVFTVCTTLKTQCDSKSAKRRSVIKADALSCASRRFAHRWRVISALLAARLFYCALMCAGFNLAPAGFKSLTRDFLLGLQTVGGLSHCPRNCPRMSLKQ